MEADSRLFNPCPLCGSKHVAVWSYLLTNPHGYQWRCGCGECGAMGPIKDTALEAQDSWNMRAPKTRETRLLNMLKILHNHYIQWPGFCPVLHKKIVVLIQEFNQLI